MKVNIYKGVPNSDILIKTDEQIIIKRGRWFKLKDLSVRYVIQKEDCFQINYFKNPNVYFLKYFEKSGVHIQLTFLQNLQFRWIQNISWLQQSDNIMWIINILVALIAIYATSNMPS